MAGALRTVPDDFEIHHIDEDRYNDSFDNLVALHKMDHEKIHALRRHAESEF